jgi:hypothetical protein
LLCDLFIQPQPLGLSASQGILRGGELAACIVEFLPCSLSFSACLGLGFVCQAVSSACSCLVSDA